MPHTFSSYQATDFENRIPNMEVNVLSSSTWRNDFSENLEKSRLLEIPIYVLFAPFHVASQVYRPPFLQVYCLQQDGSYRQLDLRKATLVEGGKIDTDSIIDVSGVLPFRLGLMELHQKHVNQCH